MKCFYITNKMLVKGFPIMKEPIPYVPVGESDSLEESVLFDSGGFKLNDIAIVSRASFNPEDNNLLIEDIGYYSNDTRMDSVLDRPVPSIVYESGNHKTESGSSLILLDIPPHSTVNIAAAGSTLLKDDLIDEKVLNELSWKPIASSLRIWIIKASTKTFNDKRYSTYLLMVKPDTFIHVKDSQYIFWNGKNIHITYIQK